MTLPGLWSMSIIDEWFWIVTLYDNKRDILISGMILSGIHCNSKGIGNSSRAPIETRTNSTGNPRYELLRVVTISCAGKRKNSEDKR